MTGCQGGNANGRTGRTRRQFLGSTAGVVGLGGLAGCSGADGDGNGGNATTPTPSSAFANYPDTGETVRIGVSTPTTGAYSRQGEHLRAGYELAAANLNDGRGVVNSTAFESLEEGILGKDVTLVEADTGSTAEGARQAATSLVEDEDVIALVGGASSEAAVAHQGIATERRIVHMAGFAPGTDVTGEHCSRFGFQEMFNGRMMASALQPVLVEQFGENATFAGIRPQSSIGETLADSFEAEMRNGAGWTMLRSLTTKVGTREFRDPIEDALSFDPTVLVLNYYGLDGAYALRQAADLVPEDVAIVVPLFNRPMARDAGAGIEDVLGTVHWDLSIDNPISRIFTQAWMNDTGNDGPHLSRPSGLAHLAYFQLFQYAAAVERAGTFEPPAVVDELEDFTYDLGIGEETMRACDHQAMRPVPVVRGLPESDQYGSRYYELVDIMAEGIEYGCDEEPASRCSFE